MRIFLYMGPGQDGLKYTLVLRDDLYGYTWLWSTSEANSECAIDAFSAWISAFGSVTWFVSDYVSHFKNKLVQNWTTFHESIFTMG